MRITKEKDVIGDLMWSIFWGVLCLVLLMSMGVIQGCTFKVDNPFYAPSTLDVNKNTSTGAANYLPVKKVNE